MRAFSSHSGRSCAGLRIGLLGGSFNPAHAGHRSVSLYALKRLGLDQIWWLVSPQNPLKSPKDMAPFEERFQQAQQMAAHPRILVTDIEVQWGKVYTAETLKLLRKRFPKTQFVWLMGADNLCQIHLWRRWPEIFASVPVAVFQRPAYAAGRKRGKAALRFDKSWIPVHQGHKLAHAKPPVWLLLDNPLNSLSATELRRQGKIL